MNKKLITFLVSVITTTLGTLTLNMLSSNVKDMLFYNKRVLYIDLNLYLGIEEDVTAEIEESTPQTVNNSDTNKQENVWFFE